METVLNFVLIAAFGIAVLCVVVFAAIKFLMDFWEIK